MSAIRVTIHSSGNGIDSLTGKESEGITCTFEDGTVTNSHLSWKSFKQLLAMKARQQEKPTVPIAVAQLAKPAQGNAVPTVK